MGGPSEGRSLIWSPQVTGDGFSWELFGETVHHVSQNVLTPEMAFLHSALSGQGLPCGVNPLALSGLLLPPHVFRSSLYPERER